MTIVMGLDVGTTTLSAVAVDAATGEVAASATKANEAKATPAEDAARGRSEWDMERMAAQAAETVRRCVEGLGGRKAEVVGLALTGQQHGVVVVDDALRPLTPFINWQDRRGEEPYPCGGTWVENARALVGEEAVERAGCRLATGYLGTTLGWLNENGQLPAGARACFGPEYIAAWMCGERPVTDPTMGASSGLFDLRGRTWDEESIDRLGLPRGIFPEVREAGDALGRLTKEAAEATGLSEGLPVCVGLGDNQASFLGSVADLRETVLVNVGTGAQVACHADEVGHGPEVETRPFARSGYLLVHAMLSGGRGYALLEEFFRQVGRDVPGVEVTGEVYERMEALAEGVPPGSDGMRCDPSFAGSRWDSERRGCWCGVSETNLTPGHMARALLEGMARSLREGWERLKEAGAGEREKLVGAGNGVRENRLLVRMIEAEFGKAMRVPVHREEAAYGVALVAGYAAGVWESVEAAGKAQGKCETVGLCPTPRRGRRPLTPRRA